jgi:hypothetical protein
VPSVAALSRLRAWYAVMSFIREARAAACSHDGTGDGCYGCIMMLAYGGFLPQPALDEVTDYASRA